MLRRSFHFIYLALVSLLVFSCAESLDKKQEQNKLHFEKVEATQSGIDFKNIAENKPELNALVYETYYNGGGVGIGDFDQDGLLDIYLGGNQVVDHLYRNKGDLKFEEISESAGILNRGGWTTGVSVADVNNDGWPDIYVCKSLLDAPELRVNELYII